jgi:isopenicillin N synthase-like dioxygenase
MSGATSFTSVPIIDISGLRSPDRAQREHRAREIGKAAGEVGFLYVSGAGVDDAVFERMLAATKQFLRCLPTRRCATTSGCRVPPRLRATR